MQAVARNVQAGVEYIQIREKDLSARELLDLTLQVVAIARGSTTKVLVNDRSDVAMAAGADGVHLRGGGIEPRVLRRILPPGFIVGVSCHAPEDLRRAELADFAVYGPVFASPGKGSGMGLQSFREAVGASPVPVLALGGVTWENAGDCLAAGAAGIAAIRLFQS
jgi:thiamine-phosphate pyrophosphorylase